MKQLNQIILCSRTQGRSYLRELAVFEEFGVVTNIECLPFRFHELIGNKRPKSELVVTLDVPIKRTATHKTCPYCGQTAIFHCRSCGFLSCTDTTRSDHRCPGCEKTFKLAETEGTHASDSGFVDAALVDQSTTEKWQDSQSMLFDLIEHRNQRQGQ